MKRCLSTMSRSSDRSIDNRPVLVTWRSEVRIKSSSCERAVVAKLIPSSGVVAALTVDAPKSFLGADTDGVIRPPRWQWTYRWTENGQASRDRGR